MHTVFIRFLSEQDRVRGFAALAKRSHIGSFPDHIYQVPIEALELLDGQCIEYRRATDEEVQAAHDQVRNSAPAVL